MQENKKQKADGKRLFLIGEEPDGERFVITGQTAAETDVEIVQQPLAQYDISGEKQEDTSSNWRFNRGTAPNGADSSYN